jgi:hypothetical protein
MRVTTWGELAGKAALARRRARGLSGFLLCAVTLPLVVTGCTGTGHATASAHPVSSCRPGLVPGYSNHRSYPPGSFPLPPRAHIIGCFADAEQAIARGFPPPVPPGTLIVRGVILQPTGPVLRSQCRAAARILGFAVPCPGLLPAPEGIPLQPPDCVTVSACVWQQTTRPAFKRFLFDSEFAAPPGYHGLGVPGVGHIVLIAEQAAAAHSANAELMFCLDQAPIRKLTIGGNRATIAACPEGSYETGGHVLLRWVHRGVLAGVSFHGVTATNIGLDLAVARHITWVSPPS